MVFTRHFHDNWMGCFIFVIIFFTQEVKKWRKEARQEDYSIFALPVNKEINIDDIDYYPHFDLCIRQGYASFYNESVRPAITFPPAKN